MRLPTDLEQGCDMVLISAGSFHHLTTRSEQLHTLQNIRALLKPTAESLAIVSLLKPEDNLGSDDEHAMIVGPYERTLLQRSVVHMCESAAPGRPTFDSDVVTATYECKNSVTGRLDRQTWSQRTVLPDDFRALCVAAGLNITSQFATFASAIKGIEDKDQPRIYFLSRSPA